MASFLGLAVIVESFALGAAGVVTGLAAAVAVPPPPPAVKPLDFNELVVQIGAAIAGNKITHEQINALLTELSIPSLPLLGSRPDLLPHFFTRFNYITGGM